MLVLAESDLFYPVHNIRVCIQVERTEMKDQQKIQQQLGIGENSFRQTHKFI